MRTAPPKTNPKKKCEELLGVRQFLFIIVIFLFFTSKVYCFSYFSCILAFKVRISLNVQFVNQSDICTTCQRHGKSVRHMSYQSNMFYQSDSCSTYQRHGTATGHLFYQSDIKFCPTNQTLVLPIRDMVNQLDLCSCSTNRTFALPIRDMVHQYDICSTNRILLILG